MRNCSNNLCEKPLVNKKSQKKYCSMECSSEHKKMKLIQSWLTGDWNGSRDSGEISTAVRNFLLEEAGYKCSECGWDKINPVTGKCPVEIDHIDGNSENNLRSNLRVLCPNCHSLTMTYKALNMNGRGTRAYRKKYNQFDLVPPRIGPTKTELKLTCHCGRSKATTSSQCSVCWESEREAKLIYPPVDEMLEQVHKIGLTEYAKTFDKSANTIKKYLITRGVDKNDLRIIREAKVVLCSSCQVQLTDEEVSKNWVRCSEHHVRTYEYPPLEDIIAGVKAMGHNKYAASIGVKYGSTVRKYLKRNGIVL